MTISSTFSRGLVLASLAVWGCAVPVADRSDEGAVESDGAAVTTVTTGYVTVRRDTRKCMFPTCSGWWVKPAETNGKMKCANGTATECYVPELQTSLLKMSTSDRKAFDAALARTTTGVVLYGTIAKKSYDGRALGTFAVQKAWVAPNDSKTSTLHFVSKNHSKTGRPLQAYRLNYSGKRTFDAIDFGAAPGTDTQWDAATAAANGDEGLILSGAISPVKIFEADQFFFRFPSKTTPSCSDALASKVTAITDGLTWPSESDYPIDFVKGGTAVSDNEARRLGGADASAVVEKRDFNEWFAHVLRADPEDPISVANAERFASLKKTLESNLTGLAVYRFGTISIRVVIIGKTSCGDVAGIATTVIET